MVCELCNVICNGIPNMLATSKEEDIRWQLFKMQNYMQIPTSKKPDIYILRPLFPRIDKWQQTFFLGCLTLYCYDTRSFIIVVHKSSLRIANVVSCKVFT